MIQIPEHRKNEIECGKCPHYNAKGYTWDEICDDEPENECPSECVPECPACAAEAILKQVLEIVKGQKDYYQAPYTKDENVSIVLGELLSKLESIK